MFTFRAELHQATSESGGHDSFQALRYRARRINGHTEVALFDEAAPYAEERRVLHVGDREPYAVVYVMNAAGRTVDTIR